MRNQCSIPDCGRDVHGRGWCKLHWQRWYRWGDPLLEHQPRKPLPPMKTCNACHRDLPRTPEFFHRNRQRLDGLYGTCKPCLRAHHRSLRAASVEERRATEARWRNANRVKTRAAMRKYRAKNPEKKRGEARAWRAANPDWQRQHWQRRRFKKAGTFRENVDPLILWERDGRRCGICGKAVALRDVSVDHIIPLSKGGEHSYANVQLAHRVCNSRRNNRGPAQTRLPLDIAL